MGCIISIACLTVLVPVCLWIIMYYCYRNKALYLAKQKEHEMAVKDKEREHKWKEEDKKAEEANATRKRLDDYEKRYFDFLKECTDSDVCNVNSKEYKERLIENINMLREKLDIKPLTTAKSPQA